MRSPRWPELKILSPHFPEIKLQLGPIRNLHCCQHMQPIRDCVVATSTNPNVSSNKWSYYRHRVNNWKIHLHLQIHFLVLNFLFFTDFLQMFGAHFFFHCLLSSSHVFENKKKKPNCSGVKGLNRIMQCGGPFWKLVIFAHIQKSVDILIFHKVVFLCWACILTSQPCKLFYCSQFNQIINNSKSITKCNW